MAAAASPEFRFGDFRLRPAERQLLRGGADMALTARAFDVLLALVEHAGQLVSKEALMQRVWAGLVVEDNNLAVQVGVLRKLLGADAIATVPGHGYRFVLPLEGEGAAAAPAPARRGSLPAATTPLFGRDDELGALRACVTAQRLVTVVGAGGIGKSQLAQEVGRGLADRWRDGVWWLELAGLADPALLVAAVAQTLGLSISDRESGPSALAAALAEREALLIVDNCEHLLEAVAALLGPLLAGAPGLHVLATSQEPLRLAAEQQFRLNPLAVPADAQTPNARSCGALAWLVSRVRSAAPNYDLGDAELTLAIDLCRRLDGLPLAIELAAARVPLLGLRTVHDRLDERFRLLTAGARTALRRHQTLRAALAWSHGLLDDIQRTVFMRLGVFSGGFTMALAQALCTDEQRDEWKVLEALAALVEKSLVVAEAGAVQRYRLLESARAYALEQLAAARETASMLQRHASTMLAHLRRVDDANMDGELRTDEYAAQVLPELDNLRAAYAWAAGRDGDPALAFGLAAHVGSLLDYSLEFVAWMLDQRARVAASGVDEATLARFQRGLAASNMSGFATTAEQLDAAHQAAALYQALGWPKRIVQALRRVLVSAVALGKPALAAAAMAEMQALVQSDWGPEFEMMLLHQRARVARGAGQLDTTEALYRESLRLARDVFGDWRLEVIEQTCLADVIWQAGRHAQALALLDELLLGLETRPASDYELIDALETKLLLLSDMGDIAGAAATARIALPVMSRMPRISLPGMAHLLLQLGRPDAAARALGAFEARSRAGLEPWEPFWQKRMLAATRAGIEATLAPDALSALLAAGEQMGRGGMSALLAEALASWEGAGA